MNNTVKDLMAFLDASPNAFFAVKNICDELEANGFVKLNEYDKWELEAGQGYFVTRNGSAVIAFKAPEKFNGFNMFASHTDSPLYKIKPNAEIEAAGGYRKLNVERYGGMIADSWFDRPLSVAGRIVVNTEDGIETRLVNVDKDLLVIPHLAIHMSRGMQEGKLSVQTDMLPLAGGEESKDKFMEAVAKAAGVSADDIIDTDLYLYNRMKATVIGLDEEFICSGRLDDLQCTYAGLKAIIDAKPEGAASVFCAFDNEEVGSGTKQGAVSPFLEDVLRRLAAAFGLNDEDYLRALAGSFMISADNAHSVHPNHPEKADIVNKPVMNKGIVIKFNASQTYTTDAISSAVFKKICKACDVPVQEFVNNSDIPGGSTLGNLSTAHVAVNTVDIGLAQLAMHSCYETAGCADTDYLIKAVEQLYKTSFEVKDNKILFR